MGGPLTLTQASIGHCGVKGDANFPGSLVAGAGEKGVGTKLPAQAGELKSINASAILSARIYGTLGLPRSFRAALSILFSLV
jgi:hypothetical protein